MFRKLHEICVHLTVHDRRLRKLLLMRVTNDQVVRWADWLPLCERMGWFRR